MTRKPPESIRDYINEKGISGIHLEPTSRRVYPYETLAAQVVGFTNASNEGCEGVEAAYNSFLAGSTGRVITTKGNNEMDMPFSYENYVSSRQGDSVILTLDATVQACLEKQLSAAIARYDVQNGAFGLVMNCKTGEILAMATLGSYDPNNYLEIADEGTAAQLEEMKRVYLSEPEGSEAYEAGKTAYGEALSAARLKQWRNRVISDGYEPGSTFKVLTMSAALDCGAIDLNTPFHCSGSEQIPGRAQKLHCWRSTGHGAEKTPQALQNSCNIAFAHIALKLGGERFYEYVKNFGVLEKTGIDLAGESKGVFFDKALGHGYGQMGDGVPDLRLLRPDIQNHPLAAGAGDCLRGQRRAAAGAVHRLGNSGRRRQHGDEGGADGGAQNHFWGDFRHHARPHCVRRHGGNGKKCQSCRVFHRRKDRNQRKN